VDTLREFRRQKGWSQKDLAVESGVGQDTISGIEKGRHEPRPSTLRKLADALDVEVADFFRELALPKAEAPGVGQAQTSTKTFDEFHEALARVLEPVRTEALRDQQATNRLLASEGITQTSIGEISEAEAENRFLDEFSPDERARAFGEIALGYARLERDNTNLQDAVARGRELLQERDEKIAQLEEENAHLRDERERETAR
jgi:transcriptional regulator with XRE-family HTH domain